MVAEMEERNQEDIVVRKDVQRLANQQAQRFQG